MAWPNRVYVATQSLGVYYTENFGAPSDPQPIWTAVNDGLPATDCRQFFLDPHDEEGRQFVLLGTSRTLYRRVGGGAWTSILTTAEARALLGGKTTTVTHTFWADRTLAGRLWVFHGSTSTGQEGYYALYTDDYGDNWTAVTPIFEGTTTYDQGQIVSHGDNVWVGCNYGGGGSNGQVRRSADKGATWPGTYTLAGSSWSVWPHVHPDGTGIYVNSNVGGADASDLEWGAIGIPLVVLQDALNMAPNRPDLLRIDPDDPLRQWILKCQAADKRLFSTIDSWATVVTATPGTSAIERYCQALWNLTPEQFVYGCTLTTSPVLQPHVVGVTESAASTSIVGRAGSSPASSPYTNSIPNTCDGVALNGIAVLGETPGSIRFHAVASDMAVTVPEPMWGDRSAWASGEWPDRHTIEALAAEYTLHVPPPGAVGGLVRSDGTHWQRVNALSHSELSGVGASDHHNPVTLDANADTVLSLSTQALGLDTQAANTIWAGPTVGAAAVPTFRALHEDDLPAHDHGGGSAASGYATSVGDGGTASFDVTHSLNTTDVLAQVWDTGGTPRQLVDPDLYVVDADTVRVSFSTAPSADQYRVVIIGVETA